MVDISSKSGGKTISERNKLNQNHAKIMLLMLQLDIKTEHIEKHASGSKYEKEVVSLYTFSQGIAVKNFNHQ